MDGRIILFGLLSVILISGCVETQTPDERFCMDDETAIRMSLAEALEIAMVSECVQEGPLTDESFCNEYTGTWWINMDVESEMCNPACVVNVVTKQAEINWRCLGVAN